VLAVGGRQWPLLAVVSRRRHRARQAQGQSVIADATILKLYPRSAADRHCRAYGFRAVAAGRPAVRDIGGRRGAGALRVAPLREFAAVVGKGDDVKARDFLALLDRYPQVRSATKAAILSANGAGICG